VAYLFTRQGVISFAPGTDEERVLEVALEAGAEDIAAEEDESISVVTPWELLSDVAAALSGAGLTPADAEVSMVAGTSVPCEDEQARSVLKLIDALEELDDVQNVYSNGDYPDSAYED
jgi:transcriptional/translational regulatory protein YebC/TACO1